jgi:cobalt-precorrin 5A hydrolase
VLAIDEAGRFVISVLSGHVGGANELSRAIALKLDAAAVITTASDSLGTIGVDILGRDFGWVLEDLGNVTFVSASVVNEEPVGIWQESGEPLATVHKNSLPKNIRVFPSLEALIESPLRAYLIITDRLVDLPKSLAKKTVVYRPKSLVLGLGCDRGVSLEELEGLVLETLQSRKLSFLSVRALATIENRKEEPAILGFAQKTGIPLLTFAKEELNRVKDVPNPSTMAMKYVGVIGVAEPSAILGSNYGDLIVPKVKSKSATLAIASVRHQ